MGYGSALQKWVYNTSPASVKNLIATLYGRRQKRDRYGDLFSATLREISRYERMADGDLQQYQIQQTRDLLRYAQDHTRYYRELFNQYDFDPQRFQSISDLTRLPVMDKSPLRTRLDDVLSDELDQLQVRWVQTSGTTGTALRFPLSRYTFQREYAYRYLHYRLGGIEQGDRMAFCAGHPVVSAKRDRPPFWVHDRANNWLLMSSYHLSKHNLPHFIRKLSEFQPALLAGYPSSIYLLALANREAGQPVHPKAVYVASETLFDHQRQVIEGSFGCKLFMWYGNGEMSANIVECPEGNYHLKEDHSLVEILNDRGKPAEPGEEGAVICTPFANRAMPLVRYNVGDRVITSRKSVCTCGRSGRLIERVLGRSEDYIVTPDGRLVGRLDHLFKASPHITEAQIVQSSVDRILFRIVTEPGYHHGEEETILHEARSRLGTTIRIDIEQVESIERTSSGKYRFIVSTLNVHSYLQSISGQHSP